MDVVAVCSSSDLLQQQPQKILSLFPPQISSEVSQTILSQKCQTHPTECCDLIHLSSSVQTHRICYSCMEDRQLSTKNVLSIRQLLKANNDTFLSSYPVLSDLTLANSIKDMPGQIDRIMEQIDGFYKKFWETIEKQMVLAKNKQKLQIIQLSEFYQQSVQAYTDVANIEKFQKIVVKSSEGNNNKYEDTNHSTNAQKLSDYVTQHCLESKINTIQIKNIQKKFESIQKKFSLVQPRQILDLMEELCDNIDFFNGDSPLLIDFKKAACLGLEQTKKNICAGQSKITKLLQQHQQLVEQSSQQLQSQNILTQLEKQDSFEIPSDSEDSSQPFEESQDFQQPQQLPQIIYESQSLLERIEVIPLSYFLSVRRSSVSSSIVVSNTYIETEDYYFPGCQVYSSFQCYLNSQLESNQRYVIRVRIYPNETENEPQFSLGILDKKQFKQTSIAYSNLAYNDLNGGKLSKNLKGSIVKSKEKYNSKDAEEDEDGRQLEFRVNLAKQFIRVASYPDYENIAEIRDWPKIGRNDKNYIVIGIGSGKEKIRIMEFMKVNAFDDKMGVLNDNGDNTSEQF